MARVAPDSQLTSNDIDWALQYVREAYEELPEASELWTTWDSSTRESYRLEWAMPRARLTQLRAYADAKLLSDEQSQLYQDLLALIERNQPLLEALLQSQTRQRTVR